MQAHIDASPDGHSAVRPQAAISIRAVLMICEKEKTVDNVKGWEGQVRDDESLGAIGERFRCRTWRFGSHPA